MNETIEEINKEIKNDNEIVFKEELLGLDYINAIPQEGRDNFIMQIRLLAQALVKPKFTYEEIIAKPVQEFFALIKKFEAHLAKRVATSKMLKANPALTPDLNTTTYVFPLKKGLPPLSEMSDQEIITKDPS